MQYLTFHVRFSLIYKLSAISVSFGGIAGLFLGFSLLSAVEFIYYFTIRACCMVNIQKRELKKIQSDTEKRVTKFDMSLVPTFITEAPRRQYNDNLHRFGNVSTYYYTGVCSL